MSAPSQPAGPPTGANAPAPAAPARKPEGTPNPERTFTLAQLKAYDGQHNTGGAEQKMQIGSKQTSLSSAVIHMLFPSPAALSLVSLFVRLRSYWSDLFGHCWSRVRCDIWCWFLWSRWSLRHFRWQGCVSRLGQDGSEVGAVWSGRSQPVGEEHTQGGQAHKEKQQRTKSTQATRPPSGRNEHALSHPVCSALLVLCLFSGPTSSRPSIPSWERLWISARRTQDRSHPMDSTPEAAHKRRRSAGRESKPKQAAQQQPCASPPFAPASVSCSAYAAACLLPPSIVVHLTSAPLFDPTVLRSFLLGLPFEGLLCSASFTRRLSGAACDPIASIRAAVADDTTADATTPRIHCHLKPHHCSHTHHTRAHGLSRTTPLCLLLCVLSPAVARRRRVSSPGCIVSSSPLRGACACALSVLPPSFLSVSPSSASPRPPHDGPVLLCRSTCGFVDLCPHSRLPSLHSSSAHRQQRWQRHRVHSRRIREASQSHVQTDACEGQEETSKNERQGGERGKENRGGHGGNSGEHTRGCIHAHAITHAGTRARERGKLRWHVVALVDRRRSHANDHVARPRLPSRLRSPHRRQFVVDHIGCVCIRESQ